MTGSLCSRRRRLRRPVSASTTAPIAAPGERRVSECQEGTWLVDGAYRQLCAAACAAGRRGRSACEEARAELKETASQ